MKLNYFSMLNKNNVFIASRHFARGSNVTLF